VLGSVLGLIFGSFATVAAYRIPRRETIVSGRSKCPACGATIRWYENIPVVSWLAQRGRCRHCGQPISVRYLITELVTAVLFALAFAKYNLSPEAFVFAAFFWVLVVLTVIDLEHRLLPNRIVYPAFVVGWIGLTTGALSEGRPEALIGAALGALIFGGFFLLIALVYPAGMGGGDVKLALVLGSFLGYEGGVGVTLAGMFLSFLLGGVVGVTITVVKGGGRKSQVPFGPFLAAGTIIAVLGGESIVDAYLSSL
jgi:leader peptidase (prepilin peptidase)/N-methyltransferase